MQKCTYLTADLPFCSLLDCPVIHEMWILYSSLPLSQSWLTLFLSPDAVISVHNLETFALKFTLHKTKGATVFAVSIKVCFGCIIILF